MIYEGFSYCKAIFHQVVNVFINTCLHDAKFLLSVVRRLLWRRKSPFSSWDHSWLSHFFALVHPLCLECAKVMFFYFWRKFFFPKFYMAFVLKIENSFYPWFYPWTNNNRKVCKNLTTALCDVYSVPGITRGCHFESELVDWVMLPCK